MKARILTTLLLASTMLVTQMTTSLPGAALDLARPAQPMEVAIHTGRIAFASDRDENWEVYTMNADGTDQTRLTDDWRLDYGPISSPDGEHIAFVPDRFVSELRTDGEIYVMKADDSEVRNLTNHRRVDIEPAWSPDGTKIAFMSRRDGNAEIYVMNADGSDQVNVSNHTQSDFLPSWQPQVSGGALA